MHRFVQTFLTLLITLIGVTAAINAFIDPYEQFHFTSVDGINSEKYNGGSRISKSIKVTTHQFSTLIMGTSRAEIGFSTSHLAWQERPVYNLSLNAASMDEVYKVFQYARAQHSPKVLFLSVDLLMFNRHNKLPIDFERSLFSGISPFHSAIQSLLGFDTLNQSRKTFRRNIKGIKSYYTPSGQRIGQYVFKKPITKYGQRALFWNALTSQYIQNTFTYKNFVFDPKKMLALKNIIHICYKEHIKLYIIIPPIHALQLETMVQMNLWHDFERMLRDILSIAQHTNTPVYDFTSWEGINAESLPHPQDIHKHMTWYWEASHFKETLGNKVIKAVLTDKKEEAFGLLLNTQHIDAYLKQKRSSRALYLKRHQYDIQSLWRLLQKHGVSINPTPFEHYSQNTL